MLRIVERIMGEGYVTQGAQRIADAGYSLSVYREWEPGDHDEGAVVIEGHLIGDPAAMATLVGRDGLRLHLDDARTLAFHLISADGAIAGADERGFEPAP